jgi:GT2 family glycosyltransferase
VKSAVVIVNWNSGGRLASCLQSLPAGPEAIVVIDNASADDSLKTARDSGAGATFIENSSNRGFAAAVNQGFAATSAQYVLLLNPDVRVIPGSIEILEHILDEQPRVGAVGGYVNEKYLPRPPGNTVDGGSREPWHSRWGFKCKRSRPGCRGGFPGSAGRLCCGTRFRRTIFSCVV